MESKQIALIAVIAISIIACASVAVFMINSDKGDPAEPEPEFPDLNDKILLVYFSATEVTAGVSEKILDRLNCDVYRIEPVIPYTKEDLERDNPESRVSKENSEPSFRPPIAGEKIDISRYSTIVLGFPIWYHKEPQIIKTFLDQYDLGGKNIVPFCTSWSAGISGAAIDISMAEPKAKMWEGGQFSSGYTDDEIYSWLDKVGLKEHQ